MNSFSASSPRHPNRSAPHWRPLDGRRRSRGGTCPSHARWTRVGPLEWRDAWVLKVASREALHEVRRRPPLPPPDHDRDESDDVVLRVALVAALIGLPRRQRETIVLRYLCDLPETEVALASASQPGP